MDTGSIIVNADILGVFIANPTLQTTGTVAFAPRTASTSIGVVGASGTLAITSGILSNTTAGNITIGRTDGTGNITVAAYTEGANTTIESGSGNIEFSGAQTLGSHSLVADSSTGNIQLDNGATIASTATSGYPITLAASGGDFINNSGSASPLSTGAGGFWRVYSTTSATDTNGASVMNPTTVVNSTSYPTTTGESGNTWFYSGNTNEGTIDITANAVSATYGNTLGTLTFSCTQGGVACSAAILSDLTGGLGLTNENSVSEVAGVVLSHANGFDVSSSPFVLIQNALTWASGYTGTIDFTSASLTLAAKPVTVTGMTASNKTYDGTTAATVNNSGDSLSGVLAGDSGSVTLSGAGSTAGTFASKNAGTGTVTASGLSLTGGLASDYSLTAPTATATINPAGITVTANNQSMKQGSAVPSLTDTYSGLVGGDSSASFTGALATTGTSSSASGAYPITEGTLAATGNYNIGSFNDGSLTITAAFTASSIPPTVVRVSQNPPLNEETNDGGNLLTPGAGALSLQPVTLGGNGPTAPQPNNTAAPTAPAGTQAPPSAPNGSGAHPKKKKHEKDAAATGSFSSDDGRDGPVLPGS